jgi:hypothetical protein
VVSIEIALDGPRGPLRGLIVRVCLRIHGAIAPAVRHRGGLPVGRLVGTASYKLIGSKCIRTALRTGA